MTITLAEKQATVESLSVIVSKAISAVIVDYRGLTANQMTQLRTQARLSNVYVKVVRNTLTKRVFVNTEFEGLTAKLTGSIFLAFSLAAPGDAARLLQEFTKIFETLQIKALSVGGKIYEPEFLDFIAKLPTKNEAIMKLMYVMKASTKKLVCVLSAINTKLLRTLVAIKDAKQ